MAQSLAIESVVAFDGPNAALPCRAVQATLRSASADLDGTALRRLELRVVALRRLRDHVPCEDIVALLAQPTCDAARAIAVAAVELQRLFANDVRLWSVARDGGDLTRVAVACDDPIVGAFALHAAAALVRAGRDEGEPPEIARFVTAAAATAPDTMMQGLFSAARHRGIPVQRLSDGRRFARHLRFGHGRNQRQAIGTISDATSTVASSVVGSKRHLVHTLGQVGLPVPRQELVASVEQAVAAAERIGYPVVVKPDRGTGGRNITAGVVDRAELAAAYGRARAGHVDVVVEEMLPGEDHRLLVCGGRLVAATQRRRAGLVGDGRSSVRQLIDRLNADPRRGAAGVASLIVLTVDEAMLAMLARQGLDLESVPEAGREVLLRSTSNIKSGGTPVDMTASVHPDNRLLAETVADALGLDLAGIDLLIPDIARSHLEQRCGVVEVNISPGLDIYGSLDGETARVAGHVLDTLFPGGAAATVPLAVVLGRRDGRGGPVAAAIAEGLGEAGLLPLWYDGTAVRAGDRVFAAGIAGSARAGAVMLAHPHADAAVLLCQPAHVLARGLPWERCDVVVLADEPGTAADDVVAGVSGCVVRDDGATSGDLARRALGSLLRPSGRSA